MSTSIDRTLKHYHSILTPEKLKAWLNEFLDVSEVGAAASCDDCVIYRYLKANGLPVISVSTKITTLDFTPESGPLKIFRDVTHPDWVKDYIEVIDEQDETHRYIYKGEALLAFDYIAH